MRWRVNIGDTPLPQSVKVFSERINWGRGVLPALKVSSILKLEYSLVPGCLQSLLSMCAYSSS